MISLYRGNPIITGANKTPSTEYSKGQFVKVVAGLLVNAIPADAVSDLLIMQRDVVVTDTDYADPTNTEVEVLIKENEYRMTTDAVLTAAMVGSYFDLADENTLAVGAAGTKIQVIAILEDNLALVRFNG